MLRGGRRREVLRGSVLLLDVSGSTPLAESLMPLGRSGAATLSRILNGALSRSVEIIHRRGGVVADFEGDALFGVFPGRITASAARAAVEISGFFRRDGRKAAPSGNRPLAARISLAHGTIEWGIVGSAGRVHYVRGSALDGAREAAGRCEPGEIRCHRRFLDAAGVEDLESLLALPEPDAGSLTPSVMGIRRSTALLFASETVVASALSGEFRQVVPVFLELSSVAASDTLQSVGTRLMELLESFGGTLAGLYPKRGGRASALALFGAPLSRENDARRACDFALRVSSELGRAVRVGIACGTAYAGMVGGRRRCAYTALGDPVNLASRIASLTAPGEILADASTLREAPGFRWEEGGARAVRGRSGEVRLSRLLGERRSPIRARAPGRLIGRDPELTYLLQRAVPHPSGGSTGLTLLYGSPGIGKSRLLAEVAAAVPPGVRILSVRCDDIARRSLGSFLHLLRDLAGTEDPGEPPAGRSRFRDRLGALAAEALPAGGDPSDGAAESLEILADLAGFASESPESRPPRFENVAMAFGWLFGILSARGPVLLLLDDVQWLDDDSRRLLRILAGRFRALSVSVLAAGRSLDDGSRPPVGIEGQLETRALDLGGLSGEAIRLLAAERLGLEPGARLMDLIGERTLGNPLYVEQFCLYLKDSELLAKDADGCELTPGRVELPSGIRSILVARMDRLSTPLRDLVQTASVIGREFTVGVLAEISGRHVPESLLLEGERERLWSPVGEGLYSFDHALTRDAAYGMLLGSKLRRLHAGTAEALIREAGGAAGAVAASVALHYESAAESAKAVEWGWKALRFATDGHRSEEALEWADRLAGWLVPPRSGNRPEALLVDVLLAKDRVLDGRGERGLQAANLDLLTDFVEREGWESCRPRVLLARGTLAYLTGRPVEAERLYAEGLETARSLGDRSIEGKILGNLGILRNLQGMPREAMDYYRTALDIHRGVGNRTAEGNVLGNMAILERLLGNLDAAETHYQEALRIHRETGGIGGEASVLCGIGNLLKDRGRWDEALDCYREAVTLNRAAGEKRYEASVMSNIGNLEAKRGNHAEAAACFTGALGIHRRIGNPNGEADTLAMMAEMQVAMGRPEEARDSLLEVLALCSRTGSVRRECNALGSLGRVYASLGRTGEAVSCYEEAVRKASGEDLYRELDRSLGELRSLLLERGVPESELPPPGVIGPEGSPGRCP